LFDEVSFGTIPVERRSIVQELKDLLLHHGQNHVLLHRRCLGQVCRPTEGRVRESAAKFTALLAECTWVTQNMDCTVQD
jgi:hypothetical protein